MMAFIGIVAMLVLMLVVQVPVGFSMAIVGFCGLWAVIGIDGALVTLATETWNTFRSYGLTVIPLFVLMGFFAFYSGVSKNLYKTSHVWFGRLPGGLAMSTIVASAWFSAICGSSPATAATMTPIALPEMKKYGYKPELSTASLTCGATLGVLIPPSVILIIYGIQTQQSIAKLFYGSTLPGCFLAFLLCLTIYAICKVRKEWGPGGEKTSFMDKVKAIPGALDMFFIFLIVMGGLYTGSYTATEAGAAGAFLAFFVGAVIRRTLTFKGFIQSIIDTLNVSAMVILILWGATIFGRFLTAGGLPAMVTAAVQDANVPRWVIMLAMMIIYLIAGSLMDALAFMIITLPIFFPVITALGYDPIWFGCFVTFLTSFGAITPPVGMCAFVVAGMSDGISLATVFKGIIWFIPAYIISILVMWGYLPLTLWLPKLLD
jgi:C4-dicarboxylate transporter DctM subunit